MLSLLHLFAILFIVCGFWHDNPPFFTDAGMGMKMPTIYEIVCKLRAHLQPKCIAGASLARAAAAENQERDLRRTMNADRRQRRGAPADVHHGVPAPICAAGIAYAVTTWSENGTHDGQPDLPTMVVASQHQIHLVSLGPIELIGGVG
jgi:hypothetical protein